MISEPWPVGSRMDWSVDKDHWESNLRGIRSRYWLWGSWRLDLVFSLGEQVSFLLGEKR